ncbi:thiopeptide-type bacteriocin [Rheinheimera sp. NSM]|uniref:thiopeptide-type bacteriocin n=1 Tax=Rheinheimera sp. NSM TaxID=3457884 RepID=UPI0040374710
MSNEKTIDTNVSLNEAVDFDVLEASEATAVEEMGASSTISAGSTCSGVQQPQ